MLSSRVRAGKAYVAEQKIREFKNFFLKVNMYIIKQPRINIWFKKINTLNCQKYEQH